MPRAWRKPTAVSVQSKWEANATHVVFFDFFLVRILLVLILTLTRLALIRLLIGVVVIVGLCLQRTEHIGRSEHFLRFRCSHIHSSAPAVAGNWPREPRA